MDLILNVLYPNIQTTKKLSGKFKDIFPENYYYHIISKQDDVFFASLSTLRNIKFLDYNDTTKQQEIINMKTHILIDLDAKKLYNTFKYTPEMGSITDIHKMIHNNKIHPFMIQFCADYYDFNLFIIDHNLIFAYYKENLLIRTKQNVFMVKDQDMYYPLNKHIDSNCLIFQKLIKFMVLPNLKYLDKHTFILEDSDIIKNIKKLKLEELQQIAISYQISVKKKGKSNKMINKRKNELIHELSHKKI